MLGEMEIDIGDPHDLAMSFCDHVSPILDRVQDRIEEAGWAIGDESKLERYEAALKIYEDGCNWKQNADNSIAWVSAVHPDPTTLAFRVLQGGEP